MEGSISETITVDQLPNHSHQYQDSVWSEAFGPMRPRRWEVGMRGRRKDGTDNDNKQYGYDDKTDEGVDLLGKVMKIDHHIKPFITL